MAFSFGAPAAPAAQASGSSFNFGAPAASAAQAPGTSFNFGSPGASAAPKATGSAFSFGASAAPAAQATGFGFQQPNAEAAPLTKLDEDYAKKVESLSKLKLAWTGPKIKTRTAFGTEIEVSGTASTTTVLHCDPVVGVSMH